MLVTCFSTARSVTTNSVAIEEFERPSAIRASTSRSRARQLIERSSRPAGEHSRHHLGIEHGPALGHAPDGVDEPLDVGYPVLEQIADALRALGQKLGRVLLLDVLREHEHARARELRSYDQRRLQALVSVGGGHLDVDDRDIGLVCAHLAQQVIEVAGLADDLEALILEQAGESRAKQERIFGEQYAH